MEKSFDASFHLELRNSMKMSFYIWISAYFQGKRLEVPLCGQIKRQHVIWPSNSLNQPKLALVHQSGRLRKEFSKNHNLRLGVAARIWTHGVEPCNSGWRRWKSPKIEKKFKKSKSLKREIRPVWAQFGEKIFFKIFGPSSCMFIYGIFAYFRSTQSCRWRPWNPKMGF